MFFIFTQLSIFYREKAKRIEKQITTEKKEKNKLK